MMTNRKIARLWYCIHTQPQAEEKVQSRVERSLQLTTYLPTYTKQGKRKEIIRPLFPSYLFVKFNIQLDIWEALYGLEGIKRLFSCGPNSPTAIPPAVIAQIRREEGLMANPDQPPAPPAYQAGQQVKILKGPMKDFIGICTKSSSQRVSILLSLFGRAFESEHSVEDTMQGPPNDGST